MSAASLGGDADEQAGQQQPGGAVAAADDGEGEAGRDGEDEQVAERVGAGDEHGRRVGVGRRGSRLDHDQPAGLRGRDRDDQGVEQAGPVVPDAVPLERDNGRRAWGTRAAGGGRRTDGEAAAPARATAWPTAIRAKPTLSSQPGRRSWAWVRCVMRTTARAARTARTAHRLRADSGGRRDEVGGREQRCSADQRTLERRRRTPATHSSHPSAADPASGRPVPYRRVVGGLDPSAG